MKLGEDLLNKIVVLCAHDNSVYYVLRESYLQIEIPFNQANEQPGELRCEQPKDLVNDKPVFLDIYDKKRNAFYYTGSEMVIAHPPCRFWGKLKGLAKNPDKEREKDLGRYCVQKVVANGGVLEHPCGSDLFKDQGLPEGGTWNEKGFTLELPQRLFGHLMVKNSWFFFSGIEPKDLLAIEPIIPGHSVKGIGNLSKKQREGTPVNLAKWLIDNLVKVRKGVKHA